MAMLGKQLCFPQSSYTKTAGTEKHPPPLPAPTLLTLQDQAKLYVFMKWNQKYGEHHCHAPSNGNAGSKRHDTVSRPPQSMDRTLCDFQGFYKVTRTKKETHFESIQGIEAAMTAQIKTLRKQGSRAATENGKDDGMRVFEVRRILRGSHGNVSLLHYTFNI